LPLRIWILLIVDLRQKLACKQKRDKVKIEYGKRVKGTYHNGQI